MHKPIFFLQILLLSLLLFTLGAPVHAQYGINGTVPGYGSSLPSGCSPNAKRSVLFFKTGSDVGLYECKTPNSWTKIGGAAIGSTLPGGTSGSVPFINSAGQMAQNNANFSYDETSARLSVTNIGQNSQMLMGETGGIYVYALGRDDASGLFSFYGTQSGFTGYIFGGVNGERMRVSNGGNLLIGTNADDGANKLQVNGGAKIAGTLTLLDGTQKAVTFGAANSGGTGFKMLRIAN